MLSPVTVEVVRNSLPAAANEMAYDLQRTSYNMMIYEVRDYCCAILGVHGELLAQNVGGVSHFVADLDVIIQDSVERFGVEFFQPGDAFIMNHQRVCGQHLNNIVTYAPIFADGVLFGFSMVRAHWVDVGGLSTGFGASGLAADPWMEGLQLDQVRVISGGEPDEQVMRMIRDNIRYPESSMGDLRAQIAACRLGERRIEELVSRYGMDDIRSSIDRIFVDSELRSRQVVEQLPDGEYIAEAAIDHDFVDRDDPVSIKAIVRISGSDMEIDLSECAKQRRGAVNSRTRAAAFVAYKALTAPHEAVNQGSFAALKVTIAEGTFMMAQYPAPMASWSTPVPTVVDTILRALSGAMRDRIPAAHFGTLGAPMTFFGMNPRTGRRFVVQSIEGGGWGGRPGEDGASASVSICQGDVRNAPIEGLELKFPILVEERSLREDSGGPGRYRGGLGVRTRVRSLVDGTWSMSMPGRNICPPWGLWGGKQGTVGYYEFVQDETSAFERVDGGRRMARSGSITWIRTGGGGGWGSPLYRSVDEVLMDVREGYVSVQSAFDDYGVVLKDETLAVDLAATETLRAKRLRDTTEGAIV
ncbi:MAG: hydantoinase B/oxoprolinase family protein [Acidimicrobiaceae bacterium]|nr:hydantoinase B/oxoprolinase family protein [Acidimicrobiaceae bacterium]